MKVFDRNLTPASAPESGRTQETGRSERGDGVARSGSSGAGGSGDRVELSGTLSSLARALTGFSAGRAERVAQLASAYRAGTYRPDSVATSRGMIADALSASVPEGA